MTWQRFYRLKIEFTGKSPLKSPLITSLYLEFDSLCTVILLFIKVLLLNVTNPAGSLFEIMFVFPVVQSSD